MAAPPPQPAPCRTCGRASPDEVLVCPHDGSQLPLERRLLDGKFRLEKRLGHGGMASVWQATNELVQKPVAIKLMHASYAEDADLLARFRNEATAAGRIGSPHICDVLDFGRSAIGPYIVMELLSGCSLSELIHAYTKLDPGLAVWIVRQALDGLDAAHRAGIVHRDLKPENIYLCRAIRDQWLVKLMDFGISKFNDSLRTGAGTTMGSPNYMAPEQIRGAEAVDARADLWSIGTILYEAITGVQPFARDTIADSLAAVRAHDPPPLHARAAAVPAGLSEIVARCLHKSVEQRWPSAQALADALKPFERPGKLLREPPPEPQAGAPAGATTMRRSGAAPRALVDAAREPAPGPAARSTGAHPSVSPARSTGAHPSVSPARSTGAHPPVSSARPGGAERPPSLVQPGGAVRPPAPAAAPHPSAGPGRPPSLVQPGGAVQPAERPPSGVFPAVGRSGASARPATLDGAQPVAGARSADGASPGLPDRSKTGPAIGPAPSGQPGLPDRSKTGPAIGPAPVGRNVPPSGAFKPIPRSLANRQATGAQPAPAASTAPARPAPARGRPPPVADPARPFIIAAAVVALGALVALVVFALG